LDLLLLKAESLARSRWCYLTELDEEGTEIYWWKYSEFSNGGLWRERTPICTPANYKAMSEEALFKLRLHCILPWIVCDIENS
jgi:hypothetical protein